MEAFKGRLDPDGHRIVWVKP